MSERAPDDQPRVQVVVAHPDDETFGCGSVLLHAAAAGATTAVCCATRGEAGEAPTGSDLGPAELGAVREEELRAAAAVLGVTDVRLLTFADSGMNGDAGPDTLVGAPYEEVVAQVDAAVTAFRPDVLVTLDAGDGHRDHARVRDAALEVARTVGVRRVYLHALPRSLLQRWVDHMRVERPDVEHLDADVTQLGTPDEQVTTVVDTAAHLQARERAIAAHRSQTSPFEGLPAELRRAFLVTDHLVRVVPPWTGGRRESDFLGR